MATNILFNILIFYNEFRKDPEILDLCAKMLESENILFDLETQNIWNNRDYIKVTYRITIFKPKNWNKSGCRCF